MNGKALDRRSFLARSAAIGCACAFPGAALADANLRYACKGELHKDFHASILDGVNYLVDNFGEAAAREVLQNTATKVYRQMHEKLVRGGPSELLEWWRYYLEREGGDFALDEKPDGMVTLT